MSIFLFQNMFGVPVLYKIFQNLSSAATDEKKSLTKHQKFRIITNGK